MPRKRIAKWGLDLPYDCYLTLTYGLAWQWRVREHEMTVEEPLLEPFSPDVIGSGCNPSYLTLGTQL